MASQTSVYESYMRIYELLKNNQTNWEFSRQAFGASYHKNEDQLQPIEKEWTKKINVLGAFWGITMNQNYGRTESIKIEQAYVNLEEGNTYLTVSYPVVFASESPNLNNRLG